MDRCLSEAPAGPPCTKEQGKPKCAVETLEPLCEDGSKPKGGSQIGIFEKLVNVKKLIFSFYLNPIYM